MISVGKWTFHSLHAVHINTEREYISSHTKQRDMQLRKEILRNCWRIHRTLAPYYKQKPAWKLHSSKTQVFMVMKQTYSGLRVAHATVNEPGNLSNSWINAITQPPLTGLHRLCKLPARDASSYWTSLRFSLLWT